MRTRLLLAVLVGLALPSSGCDDDKAKKAGATTASTTTSSALAAATGSTAPSAAPSASASATAASKPLGERLRCDLLMPDKTLPGALSNMKVGQPPPACPECGPTCTLVKGGNPIDGASVHYTCNEKYDKATADKKIEDVKKTLKKTKPVTEFGRGGVGGEKESGLFYDVVAYDDDSDCFVAVSWMRGKREEAVMAAKYALMGIKQSDLK